MRDTVSRLDPIIWAMTWWVIFLVMRPSGLFVGQAQQDIRHPTVHVQQDQASDLLIRTAEPAGELTQQPDGDFGRATQPGLKVLTPQHQDRRIRHRDDVCRARLIVDQRHLAEEAAFPKHGKNDLAAILADQDDLHLARGDQVERVARVILEQDDAALRVAPLPHQVGKRDELGFRQTLQTGVPSLEPRVGRAARRLASVEVLMNLRYLRRYPLSNDCWGLAPMFQTRRGCSGLPGRRPDLLRLRARWLTDYNSGFPTPYEPGSPDTKER